MHIVHIATELAPIAKVGGLGDVLYGLSKALVQKQHRVEILIPKYDCIDFSQLKQLKIALKEMNCLESSLQVTNTIWSAEFENLRVLLLEAHHPLRYFDREMIYGCPDDVERFSYFCKAALEYLRLSPPDIIHIHDWPTALVATLFKEIYQPMGFKTRGIVLTIHNLEYQGRCSPEQIARLGLQNTSPLFIQKMQDPSSSNMVNLLKGGIEFADLINTVSPTYEKEILVKENGAGLNEVLVRHQNKFRGIINGIDTEYWNPEKDPFLIERYRTGHSMNDTMLSAVLKGKAENRKHLHLHFNMLRGEYPLVASVSRLASQKGPELLLHAIQTTLKSGGGFVLLGSDHGSPIEKQFLLWNGVEQKVGIAIDKNEALAHLIFAAADLLIIPSKFEPCGLTQMIALRYGTIPLVRRTGGLADTVFDIDDSEKSSEERNGYVFDAFDSAALDKSLHRALNCWTHNRSKWEQMLLNGMKMDYSWKKSADQYLEMYTHLINTLNAN